MDFIRCSEICATLPYRGTRMGCPNHNFRDQSPQEDPEVFDVSHNQADGFIRTSEVGFPQRYSIAWIKLEADEPEVNGAAGARSGR